MIAPRTPPQTYREHLTALFMTVTQYYCDHRETAMPEDVVTLLNDMYHCVHCGGPHASKLQCACEKLSAIPLLVRDPSVRAALMAAKSVLTAVV